MQDLNTSNFLQIVQALMIWGVTLIFKEVVFFLLWPAGWENKENLKDICFLEMIPVVLAIEVWGLKLRNKKVVLTLTILNLLVLLINKPLSPKG